MDVTLYVWRLSATNVGHASLKVGDTYMSYWPAEGAGKKDVKIGQSHDAAFTSVYAIDRRLERKHADDEFVLTGLDTVKMIDDQAKSLPQRIFLRLRFFSSYINMWTPDEVLRYAKEIQSRTPRL